MISDSSPNIRLSTPADRDAILSFIQRSGFNPRDAVTWDGLQMTAMTAWIGDRLFGAIPMEPREIQIANGNTIRALHETVVAMDAEYRGGGVGSKMQAAIAEQRPGGADVLTVFREEPRSAAYRWYLKNGFSPLMKIESWFCDEPKADDRYVKVFEWTDPAVPWHMFERPMPGGRVKRRLREWLAVHPYRNRYSFWIVSDDSGSCALLGVGTMHSQTTRADLLDFVASDAIGMKSLLRASENLASKKGWKPLRIPLAVNDPLTAIAQSCGYQSKWSFDLLAKPLNAALLLREDFTSWRYAGIDYI